MPLKRLVFAVTPLLIRLLTRNINKPLGPVFCMAGSSKRRHHLSRMAGSAPALIRLWASASAAAWALGVISPPLAACTSSSSILPVMVSSMGRAPSTSSSLVIASSMSTASADGPATAGSPAICATPVAGGAS